MPLAFVLGTVVSEIETDIVVWAGLFTQLKDHLRAAQVVANRGVNRSRKRVKVLGSVRLAVPLSISEIFSARLMPDEPLHRVTVQALTFQRKPKR